MPSILCTSTPTISVGTSIYTSDTLTTLVPTGYYSTGGNSYYVLNGVVQSIGSCTPSKSSTIRASTIVEDLTICSNSNIITVYFSGSYGSIVDAMGSNAVLYTNATLTTPLTGYNTVVVSAITSAPIFSISPSTGQVIGSAIGSC